MNVNYEINKYEDGIYSLYPEEINDLENDFLGIKMPKLKMPKLDLGLGKAWKTYQENKTARTQARQYGRSERTALRQEGKAAKWGAKAGGAKSGFENIMDKVSGFLPGAQSSDMQFTPDLPMKSEETNNSKTIIIIVVVLLVLGVGAYFLLKK